MRDKPMDYDDAILLIAEDDPDDQLLIADAIGASCPRNVETRFVEDGVMLMSYLHTGKSTHPRPQLVILDLNMPRKDGRTALREIKSNPELANIPVVVLTTSMMPEDAIYCENNRVDGFYQKPNNVNDLEELLTRLCRQYMNVDSDE
jgi:CheY-like chemotaxis protein